MDGSRENAKGLYVGLDIGYGNLKAVACDSSGQIVKTLVLPVGAAPEAKCAKSVSGSVDVGDGAQVVVGGEKWVAGVSPLELMDFARPTHSEYPKTKEYLALYYAVLAKLGQPISWLATGLPVKQFYEGQQSTFLQDLRKRLEGTHYVGPNVEIPVANVGLVPQPMGAYTDLISQDASLARNPDRLALVLDVGYFSTDWVLVRGGRVIDTSSDSSTDATSRILEDAARQISVTQGIKVSPARLESAFRAGTDRLEIGDREVDYKAYIAGAAGEVAHRVVSLVQTALRSQADDVDVVAITGGGGSLFERPLRQAFPASKIAVSKDPVLANARGFMRMALSKSPAAQKR